MAKKARKPARGMSKPRTGRPSIYSDKLVAELCARIASGRSVRSVCLDPDMPGLSTVMEWRNERPEFAEQYARAMDDRADFHFEEILAIADTPVRGVKTTTKGDGSVEVLEADMIEHRRLQVDARKWIVARMAPKKYGDKLTQEVTGKDGAPLPLVPVVNVSIGPTQSPSSSEAR